MEGHLRFLDASPMRGGDPRASKLVTLARDWGDEELARRTEAALERAVAVNPLDFAAMQEVILRVFSDMRGGFAPARTSHRSEWTPPSADAAVMRDTLERWLLDLPIEDKVKLLHGALITDLAAFGPAPLELDVRLFDGGLVLPPDLSWAILVWEQAEFASFARLDWSAIDAVLWLVRHRTMTAGAFPELIPAVLVRGERIPIELCEAPRDRAEVRAWGAVMSAVAAATKKPIRFETGGDFNPL